jgi:hypothetical protein
VAKQATAVAKEQWDRLRANPTAQITTPLPRVAVPIPRVMESSQVDCHVVQLVAYPTVPRSVEQAPVTPFQSWSPWVDVQSSMVWPN